MQLMTKLRNKVSLRWPVHEYFPWFNPLALELDIYSYHLCKM